MLLYQLTYAQTSDTGPGMGATPPLAVKPATQRARLSTIQRIRDRGNLLVVGISYDYAPFGVLNATGDASGFEPDLVRALAKRWGVEVAFVPISPSARIQSLLAGQVDLIAAALPHTLENERQVDFSNPYFVDTAALLLTVESQTLAFDELSGRTVAVVQDGSPMASLTRYLDEAGIAVNLLPFQEHAAALRALAAGQADALLAGSTYLSQVAATQSPLSVILPLPSEEPLGFGLAPGDSLFRNLIDATLQELYVSGAFATLYERWFPGQPVPSFPLLAGAWPYTLADTPLLFAEPSPSRLAQLQEQGIVRVGVHYELPPFGYIGETGELQGFEVDLVRELAKRWFGTADALALVRVTPDTAIPLLSAGQVDLVAAALPQTWPNESAIDFSLPYYTDALGVLVHKGVPTTTLAALDNRRLAVVGTAAAQTQADFLFAAGAEPQLLPFQEYRAAEQALLAGQVDGLLGFTTVLAESRKRYPQLQLVAEQQAPLYFGIGIPLGDDQMRDWINITLQAMKEDGTYDRIYRRWFSSAPFALPVWANMTMGSAMTIVATTPAVAPILQPTRLLESATVIPRPTATADLVTTRAVTPASAAAGQPLAILVPTQEPSRGNTVVPVTPTALAQTPTSLVTNVISPTAPLPLPSPPIVAAVQVQFPLTVTVLSAVNINARTRPTTDAPVISLVSGGTSWPALALSEDGEWVQIALPAAVRGWVARRLLVEADQFVDDVTPVATPLVATAQVILMTPTPRPLFATATTHQITATDSLASIAQQYYGEQRLWTLIYDANRAVIGDDPNVIPIGIEIVIPAKP